MKCPECKSETSTFRSRVLTGGSIKRRLRCKKCGYEFDTYEFYADNIRDFLVERKIEKENCGFTSKSLCWKCSRATGFCSWSRDFEPVQGWDAVQTVIKSSDGNVDSYEVKSCPLFERDER